MNPQQSSQTQGESSLRLVKRAEQKMYVKTQKGQ